MKSSGCTRLDEFSWMTSIECNQLDDLSVWCGGHFVRIKKRSLGFAGVNPWGFAGVNPWGGQRGRRGSTARARTIWAFGAPQYGKEDVHISNRKYGLQVWILGEGQRGRRGSTEEPWGLQVWILGGLVSQARRGVNNWPGTREAVTVRRHMKGWSERDFAGTYVNSVNVFGISNLNPKAWRN